MDILKQELLKQRQILAEDIGGKKYFNRFEIEQKRLQRLREEENHEAEAKSLCHKQEQQKNHPNSSSKPEFPNSKVESLSSKSLVGEKNIGDLNLPKHEVIRRLRFLKQPATLFGEDGDSRLDRLKLVLNAGLFEVDDSDMTEGQTNDFLRDINVELNRKRKSRDDDGAEDKDSKRMKANFEELCDEDKILVFFKKLLNEWNQELNEMSEVEIRTGKGKSMVATFKQCARYLDPLFKLCRKKIVPDDIRQGLMVVVECCMRRDGLAAMDHYIKMAIGNAPWPIGVTMVGIHQRSAREKICTKSVAHIMNDETTRKYLQSVKRLMTRSYPTMPSRAVEFNSLANGSDLQSLLAEERGFCS